MTIRRTFVRTNPGENDFTYQLRFRELDDYVNPRGHTGKDKFYLETMELDCFTLESVYMKDIGNIGRNSQYFGSEHLMIIASILRNGDMSSL